ncbi:hypothetical protein [Pseudovibrio flavus]|nr:hypothetical protein [Pseudovibrio flavus]
MDEVSSKAGFEAQYLRSVIEDGLEPPMDKLSVICSELGMSVPELFAD